MDPGSLSEWACLNNVDFMPACCSELTVSDILDKVGSGELIVRIGRGAASLAVYRAFAVTSLRCEDLLDVWHESAAGRSWCWLKGRLRRD